MRKLRRRLGQLREARRCVARHNDAAALVLRKRAAGHEGPLIPLHTAIVDLETQIQQLQQAEALQRLNQWKERLRASDSSVRKRVRRSNKPAPAFVSPDGTPSSGVACSLSFLRTFWRRIWQREVQPDDANRAWSAEHARHRAHTPQLGWQPINASELQQQACASGGKAAGPDGWSGDEIQHWTLPMWRTYADLWNRWINHRCYPSEWQYYLQVHLPKQDPHPVHGLDVGDARPLVLEPILCRIASSAWARRATTRAWQQAWAPLGAHGGFQQRGVHTAVHALQNAYVRCYGILSLDYAKCFDRAHPNTATHALSRLGMPAEMVDLCRFQWSQQHRWLGLQGCVSAEAEVVISSLPQGDAISPIALNPWAPIQAYCREEPTATAVTYLDDRNVVVRDHAQLVRTLQFWARWAGRLGLEENVEKQKFLPRFCGCPGSRPI